MTNLENALLDTDQKSSIDNVTNGARFCPGFNSGAGLAAAAALLYCQPEFEAEVATEERDLVGIPGLEEQRKLTPSLS
jgi:hypothetical protein